MKLNESPLWGERALKAFIDRTTMYRLILYYLSLLVVVALLFGFIGITPYVPGAILWSTLLLLIVSLAGNAFFARLTRAIANSESVYITAFILALIMPPASITDLSGSGILVATALIATGSKYLIAPWKKHIFNPAAFAVVLSYFLFDTGATWWIAGNVPLLPFVVVGGLIVVYKLRRVDLVLAFSISVLVTVSILSPFPLASIESTLLYSPFFFLAFVMLTEPLTTPPTRLHRIVYGALVGIIFTKSPQIGTILFSPELALLVGNIYSFCVSPKWRLMLTLVEKKELARGIYEYIFRTDRPLHFEAGQYLEWTLGVASPDTRGNRRFFTIASAPGDETIAFATRIVEKGSVFKNELAELPVSGVVSVSSLGGDFVMPKNKKKKLAFLAGGIGVTPFASMARHSIVSGESRDAILLYASKADSEVAYRDIFMDAERVGWRTVYRIGTIDAECIKSEVPDYTERLFYISGPPGMVDAMKRTLITLGVSRFNIKTDFFPGLA